MDSSASMAFPEGPRSKWRVAGAVATGLAACAAAGGDPVGLAAGDTLLPPRTRRGVLGAMVRALDRAATGAFIVPEAPWPRRVAILSDFLDDDAALLRRAGEHHAAGGDVHAVHVVAAEELQPPATLLAVDPEHRAVRRALGPESRAGYDRAFAAWRVATGDRWRARGAAWHQVTTDEDPARAVRRIVRQ